MCIFLCVCVCLYVLLFTHSPIRLHLGYFIPCPPWLMPAMNMGMQMPLWGGGFVFSGCIPRSQIVDHIEVLFLIYWETSVVFSMFILFHWSIYLFLWHTILFSFVIQFEIRYCDANHKLILISISIDNGKSSLVFIASQTFVLFFSFGSICRNSCDMISHHGFDLYFSLSLVMLNTFSHICWLFVCLLWKNAYLNPLHKF
jgi:hypothetical protein